MPRVDPKVFLVAATQVNLEGLNEYLAHIGEPDWLAGSGRHRISDVEFLPEVMGRLCYKSFAPGLNKNVTRVRKGNSEYLSNIIRVGHGSVLEHSSMSFIFSDVSRVFTHELVRHRVGTAISQESLRFVRLEDLDAWAPSCFHGDPEKLTLFYDKMEELGQLQKEMAELFDLDNPDLPFSKKKEISSAMRRLAPIGLATTVGWTCNVRTLRHVIEMRTSRHAEEEIRVVFAEVARLAQETWPNLFADYAVEEVNGIPEYTTQNKGI